MKNILTLYIVCLTLSQTLFALQTDEIAAPPIEDAPSSIMDAMERVYKQQELMGSGFRFGKYGHAIGLDESRPGNLFGTPVIRKSPAPFQPITASATLPPQPEVNIPLAGASGGSQFIPLRRPQNYLDIPTTPAATSTERIQRPDTDNTPPQQWFRDPNFNKVAPAGQPTGGNARTNNTGIGQPNSMQPTTSAMANVTALSSDSIQPQQQVQPQPFQQPPQPNDPRRIRAAEERLTSVLSGSGAIHWLSPVKVTINGTDVTVEGVVATESSRIAAGQVLLNDPNVKRVINKINVISNDPTKRPLPVELKLDR
ncbi:MAG: BON domain-containing protein [Planctomycetaceae bacterium]|jgi:hypothetical protein|nr:BON domain-containing protein [Planctomycetaceae bacterium]